MQAYEFHATAQNGLIRIPDEYVKKVGPDIRVILFADERPRREHKSARRSLGDLIGVLDGAGDIDLDEIRTERRRKYKK